MASSASTDAQSSEMVSTEARSSGTIEAESQRSSLDDLYKHITLQNDNTELQKVLLSSSYPSPISLKLQGIQKMLKEHKGPMDTDSINFAIRILRREETIDRIQNSVCLVVRKYYFSADFVRLAGEDEQSGLETCFHNGYAYHHHNAFAQVADLKEVLFIPVHHDDGSWSLYAFNMSDQKLSILDPTRECAFDMNHHFVLQWKDGERIKEHDEMRLKIWKALRSVKDKFNLFKNTSDDFSSWRYEFTDLSQSKNKSNICTSDDSGFFVFYFMLFWDGCQLTDKENIPKPKDLRKRFLEYIVSTNFNEVYHQVDDLDNLLYVFKLMGTIRDQKASAGHRRAALTRCKMDTKLLKALRQNNVDEFHNILVKQRNETIRQNIICRGATCDGDGVLHIAVRYGELKLLCAILKKVNIDVNLEEMERQLVESTVRDDNISPPTWEFGGMWNNIYVEMRDTGLDHQQKVVMLLRSRNHKGETCLHEAVRRDNALFVMTLILVDEKNDDESCLPPLVQTVDYEGVSPLYLAAALGRNDIVEILTHKNNKHIASCSGPGGKTALHAATLNRGLTAQLLNWKDDVRDAPDLTVIADNSGNTPLHLVSSELEGASVAELLLLRSSTDAALKKDSKGWLPIHVAAANGSLDVIKELIDKCPECMEARNASGQSFLHVAVDKKRWNVVQYVCNRQSLAGILNLMDQDGNTALHLAVKGGNQSVFCALMGNPRVCLNSENREGWTPLAVAELSLGTELRLTMSSRVLIHSHLKRSGAHYGTYRRDVLMDEITGKLDKDKMSETICKSARLMAVCAIFMLNLSVTTFFNVAKQNLAPTDPDPKTAAATLKTYAEGSGPTRARVLAFKYLMVTDAITFASSLLAALCCTFAGFSIMDRPGRMFYLKVAAWSLQIACLGLVAIFIMAAYLGFFPVDPSIANVACVLPLFVIIPLLMGQIMLLHLDAWTLLRRRFRKNFLPKAPWFHYRTTTVYLAIKATMEAIWTWLAPIIAIMRFTIILSSRVLLPVELLVVAYLPMHLYYITYQHKS